MTKVALVGALLAVRIGFAANLIPDGGFSSCENGKLPKGCRSEDGVGVSLETENLTWNRCLRIACSREYTNATSGVVSWSGSAFMGAADKLGFPVEPLKNYDASVDLRGECGVRVKVAVTFWKGECRNWEDRVDVPVGEGVVRPGKDWRTICGKVRAPEGAKLAAMRISFYGSTAKGCNRTKVGDWVLADNFKFELSRKNLGVSADDVGADLPLRKAISTCDPVPITDFLDLKTLKDCEARTAIRVEADETGLKLSVDADEPGETVTGVSDKVWSGDSFEFFLLDADGKLRHFAFNFAGAQYANLGDGKDRRGEGWSLTAERTKTGWHATAHVPYALVGFADAPVAGTRVKFNAGRNRVKAKQFITWARTNSGFADTASFGTLIIGDWSAAFGVEFGEERMLETREAYVQACAEEEAARIKAKFDKFRDMKFSAAVIPVVSDYSVPFLPEEIFDPATNIHLVAAVNEIKAMPLAVANLTDRLEDCLVMLEHSEDVYPGAFGLKDFPADRIKVRRAVRMRDVKGDAPSMRLDPLLAADDACAITVPSHEAGLVWFDFDTTDVKPGKYVGRLRIVPLGEEGGFIRRKGGGWDDRTYAGKMQVIPVSLEVQPIELPKRSPIPSGFFQFTPNEEAYDLAADLGAESHQINVWRFPLTNDSEEVSLRIANDRSWAAKRGIQPRFDICYSVYRTFSERWNPKKDPATTERLWPVFLKNIKRIMNENGVSDEDYWVETQDEPEEGDLDELIQAHRLAKATVPTLRLGVTIAAWALSERRMRELAKVSDVLILWGRDYFSETWKKQTLEEFRAAGGKVCHYMCHTSMRMPLDTYFRHHVWIGERYGLDGNYFYELSKFMKRFGSTDFMEPTYGDILYYSYGRPVPSIRYCAFREGVTDIKYLAAVRSAAKGDPDAENLLEQAARTVLEVSPNDPKTPDRMRERAREILLRKGR